MPIDPRATIGSLQRAEKNILFGFARGLTQTARKAAEDVTRELPQRFDRPTPFTLRAIATTPATRDRLVATVFVKQAQAEYLEIEETGGTRTERPGRRIFPAVNLKTNAYGNLARGRVKKEKAKPTSFVSTGEGRTAHLPPGVYQRPAKGTRRDGSTGTKGPLRRGGRGRKIGGTGAKGATTLKLLVAFKKKATYRPRFRFRETVIRSAATHLPRIVGASIEQAIATSR
jgi:hypothetical protein